MKLETYLEAHSLKAAAFAREIGVEPSTVTRWLRHERTPSLDQAVKVEEVTGGEVTCADLLPPAATDDAKAGAAA